MTCPALHPADTWAGGFRFMLVALVRLSDTQAFHTDEIKRWSQTPWVIAWVSKARRLHGTLREMHKTGCQEVADEIERSPMAAKSKPLDRTAKILQGVNGDMRAVRRDPALTADQERARLDELTVERNDLLRRAVDESKGALRSQSQEASR